MSTKPYHPHVGEHLQEVCDDCLTFKQQWSGVAGEVEGLKTAVKILMDKATTCFRLAHDEEAKKLRAIANEIELGPLAEANKELDKFIHRREKASD